MSRERARSGSCSAARAAALALLALASNVSDVGAATDPFYKGKQINIICGFGPGGGYDAYARLLARHIGRHIPGNPSVVVQNMEGAGTVRASNHVYVAAAKDGTVIAAVNQNMPMYQLLGGKAAQFQAARLQWVGSLIGSNGTLYTWHTSPTRSIEDAKRRETPLGGTGTTSDSHIFPTLINKLIGTRFKVVNGYPGTREIHIALERGEVEGRGGNSWASLVASNKSWIDEKKINVIVQIGLKPEPDLPTVPLLIDLVNDPADKQAVEVITMPTVLGYGYWLAPEVPAERMKELRAAFDAVVLDKELLAEAERSKMMIRPQPGLEVEALVKKAAGLPRPIIERTAQLLEWKQ
jgi:tripartite-type tricarboxylate transporter receptor subunit TctC